ncbi:hypothetical protein PS896_03692 [Pseudomonas fluorescens]|uniref:DUF6966 domain-containing protein n=2 Tax=Pseudomonas fluorescens TaxID=294 RepID=A0A5E7M2G6_PSEFL|nr:hypothetical protein PS896_03692 [Pseudomonas fluorescens]
MRKAKTLLENSDYSGITCLLSAYGGMGSLNDLILGQTFADGVFSRRPDHLELNDRFSELRNQAAQLAAEIKRSQ